LPRFERTLTEAVHTPITPVFSTNNIGTLKRVVESGLGWGFLPLHSVQKQLRMGRLACVDIQDFAYTMNIMMYSSRSADIQPAAEVLYRALQTQNAA